MDSVTKEQSRKLKAQYRKEAKKMANMVLCLSDIHEVAEGLLGITGQSLKQKVSAGRFSLTEFLLLCDKLGYEVEVVRKEGR